jgi:hypothetical protein
MSGPLFNLSNREVLEGRKKPFHAGLQFIAKPEIQEQLSNLTGYISVF